MGSLSHEAKALSLLLETSVPKAARFAVREENSMAYLFPELWVKIAQKKKRKKKGKKKKE